MKNSSTRSLHEEYHSATKFSKRIISSKNFTYRLILAVIDKHIKKPFKNVLDIGCGAGTLSFYIASKKFTVTGIDISQKAIYECKKSATLLGLKNISFVRSSFPDEIKINKKFNAIIFTEVIEHLIDDLLAIKKINKLLKPSGILILSTPSINAPLHKLGLTKKFDEEVGHIRRYTLDQLKKLLLENDFKIIEIIKIEGILRNFLFVNPYAGKLVRYVNFFASDFVTIIDNISLKLFGESNYIIVARKIQPKKKAQ